MKVEKLTEQAKAPQWMINVMEFRQTLFLKTVEPIIVILFGPVDPALPFSHKYKQAQKIYSLSEDIPHMEPYRESNKEFVSHLQMNDHSDHRRLGYLPDFVENKLSDASYFQETSMSFATFTMLFFIMSCILLVFLNCFYHNQKTSPLFSSPRRHRLPKLVPPPLPVDGFFSWVRVIAETVFIFLS